MTKNEKFKGKIIYQNIINNKIKNNEKIRTVTISDLHNYTDSKKRVLKLARTIKELKPNIILIAGDLFNCGKYWIKESHLNGLKYFLSLVSETCPVCLTLGNHDLLNINEDSKKKILNKFYELKKIKPNYIYPLYNDKATINEIEIIGYVSKISLMSGIGMQTQLHGIAHDEFIKDYNKEGTKFEGNDNLNIFLGHNPHLISVSENGIGLGNLSVCDFFVAGHLHDGYKPLVSFFDGIKKEVTSKHLSIFNYDKGLVEQFNGVVDKDGKIIKGSKKVLGQTGLCRGIIWFNDMAQQKIWQSPNNSFYLNTELEDNKQKWKSIDENIAKNMIISDKLHCMLISEGITPIFIPKEKKATINVVDIKKYSKRKK